MQAPTNLTERVRYNTLFENITDEQFAAVEDLLIERSFRANECILDENENDRGLFLLVDGRVRILRRTKQREELLLGLLHHGDFFGELELIDGRSRMTRIVAHDDCLTYELPREAFEDLLYQHHPFAIRLLQVASVRLRALQDYFVKEINRHFEYSTAEVEKLRQLIEAAKTVNSTLDVNELLRLIVDTALSIVGAQGGTLYLIDEQKRELWSKVLKGSTMVEIRLPVGKGIAGYVAATGDSIKLSDAYLDPRFNPEIDAQTGFHTKSMLCVPIRNKQETVIGVLQLLNKKEGVFTADDEQFINALSVHSALALENARVYELERQKIAMEKEIHAARNVQMSLVPQEAPAKEGYEIAGRSLPAKVVSGDYFDYIPIDDERMAICVGDVTGKGLPAALLMANLQAILRSEMMLRASPKRSMQRSNKLLLQSTASDKFVTLFYCILDTARHQFTYSNAGHEQPLLLRDGARPKKLITGGTILGILSDVAYEQELVPMEPGDALVIYSDGITEAANGSGEQFGQERLERCLESCFRQPAPKIIDELVNAVQRFVGSQPQTDDITVVVVKRSG
ncbi:MAG TPA: SpoIIE family protein phosphatase [Bacteroidota bacterium]|nr:SpoIIE family protein phosphatase [Bacteroidota bacterium]